MPDRIIRDLKERRRAKRKRTQREFISSLAIVKDHAKIKNYRRRQGDNFDIEAAKRYRRNYEQIFGKFKPSKSGTYSGTYKWDPEKQALVRISDKIPSGRLVTL